MRRSTRHRRWLPADALVVFVLSLAESIQVHDTKRDQCDQEQDCEQRHKDASGAVLAAPKRSSIGQDLEGGTREAGSKHAAREDERCRPHQ